MGPDDLNDSDKDNLKRYLQGLTAPAQPSMTDQALNFAKQNVAVPALKAAHTVFDTTDRYAGAPIRAGLNEMQNVADKYQNAPLSDQFGDKAAGEFYGGAWNAAKNQFGQADRSHVPTGKQIMERAGLSGAGISDLIPGANNVFISPQEKNSPNASTLDQLRPEKGGMLDVSPAGLGGLALDTKTDPTMYLPYGKLRGLFQSKSIPRTMTAEAQREFIENAKAKYPNVRQLFDLEAKRGIPIESNEAPINRDSIDRAAEQMELDRLKEEAGKRGVGDEVTAKIAK
jgi:hypothetical protein